MNFKFSVQLKTFTHPERSHSDSELAVGIRFSVEQDTKKHDSGRMCCLFYFFEFPRQVGETFPLSLCLHENEMENKVDVALSGKKVPLFVKLRLLAKQITALLSLCP